MCADQLKASFGHRTYADAGVGPLAQAPLRGSRYNLTRDGKEHVPSALRGDHAHPRDYLPGLKQRLTQGAFSALSAVILAVAFCSVDAFSQATPDSVAVDHFIPDSEPEGIPLGWKPLKFRPVKVQTAYFTVSEADNHYLKAVSSAAGTGIYKPVALNVKDYPIMSWRWKVDNGLSKADGRLKKSDDFAARVYVGFHFDPAQAGVLDRWKHKVIKSKMGVEAPKWALVYVWDNRNPVGTVFDNAYTSRAKMVVVQSGTENLGRWIAEERNVYEDYLKLIGEEPPRTEFVAIMTDTDNTGDWAVTSYDDIVFKRGKP